MEITFRSSADGSNQPALFCDSGSKKKKPLLVVLHTWNGDYRDAGPSSLAHCCLEEDWALLHPDFRGPNNNPSATGSELVVQDIVDVVEYAKQAAALDPERIYLVGASGGGYTALLMAGKRPDLWAAVSAWVPIVDLAAWYHESLERGSGYDRSIVASCGGVPGDSPEVDKEYHNRSPIHFLARGGRVRVDIQAGIRDGHTGSVPVSHSIRAFNVLADEADRISQEHIEYMVRTATVPEELSGSSRDEAYGGREILLRRSSKNVTLTLFAGGHEILFDVAFDWLKRLDGARGAWE